MEAEDQDKLYMDLEEEEEREGKPKPGRGRGKGRGGRGKGKGGKGRGGKGKGSKNREENAKNQDVSNEDQTKVKKFEHSSSKPEEAGCTSAMDLWREHTPAYMGKGWETEVPTLNHVDVQLYDHMQGFQTH